MDTPPTRKHNERITVAQIRQMKSAGEKITLLSAYDAALAQWIDRAGVELILVDDDLGTAVLGYENSLSVTVEHILHHTQAVRRGSQRAFIIADLPFMSYEVDPKSALISAGRLIKDGGAHGIKVQGGLAVGPVIKQLTRANIPVLGHLGSTSRTANQSSANMPTDTDTNQLLTDAKILEASGVFCVLLEKVPFALAREISKKLSVPTIGIGSGPDCDGQMLSQDELYRNQALQEPIRTLIKQFRDRVRESNVAGPGESKEKVALN